MKSDKCCSTVRNELTEALVLVLLAAGALGELQELYWREWTGESLSVTCYRLAAKILSHSSFDSFQSTCLLLLLFLFFSFSERLKFIKSFGTLSGYE